MAVWVIAKQRDGMKKVSYTNRVTGADIEKARFHLEETAFLFLAQSNEWDAGDLVATESRTYCVMPHLETIV